MRIKGRSGGGGELKHRKKEKEYRINDKENKDTGEKTEGDMD
jgi:hypothetical protein